MCASVSVRFCGYKRLCLSLCVCVYVSVCRIGTGEVGGGGGVARVCVLIAVCLCGSACGCLCLFVHVSVCGIFNVRTDADACDCTRGLYRHRKTDLPHRGFEPASVLSLALQSAALPTKLSLRLKVINVTRTPSIRFHHQSFRTALLAESLNTLHGQVLSVGDSKMWPNYG